MEGRTGKIIKRHISAITKLGTKENQTSRGNAKSSAYMELEFPEIETPKKNHGEHNSEEDHEEENEEGHEDPEDTEERQQLEPSLPQSALPQEAPHTSQLDRNQFRQQVPQDNNSLDPSKITMSGRVVKPVVGSRLIDEVMTRR